MLPMESTPFSICNHAIRQDEAGRYCLNDLHKAAGGQNRHRPSLWLKNQRTRKLVGAINRAEAAKAGNPALGQNQGLTSEASETGFSVTEKINDLAPVNIVKGFDGDQGTYVCKELVYAYAMWVNPDFELLVIRTFDAVVQAQLKAKDAKYDRLYDKYNRDDLDRVCDSMIMQQQIRSLESEVQELRSDLNALRVDRDAYHHCLVACEHEMGEQKQEIADLRLDLSIWKPKSLQ
ncbi:MAG: KilA-N domain-containing protein [Chitinivorax sp.]